MLIIKLKLVGGLMRSALAALVVVFLALNWTIYGVQNRHGKLAEAELLATLPAPKLPQLSSGFEAADTTDKPKAVATAPDSDTLPKPVEINKENAANDGGTTIEERKPRFPGCEDMAGDEAAKKACADRRMQEWIYSEIRYPPQVFARKAEGVVIISFVVSETGEIWDIAIRKGIGGGCEEEALRVVRKMAALPEKWTPGKQGGKLVKVRYLLPIRFKLE